MAETDTTRTLTLDRTSPGQPRRIELVVAVEDRSWTRILPDSGELDIGRGESCAVRIDSPSVSRVHARLHLGATIQIEDLGSANGTVVLGTRLTEGQRADIQPGDSFEVGDALCLVKGPASQHRLRRTRSHVYFEARLDDEVARASRTPSQFSVVRVNVTGAAPALVEAELLEGVRPGDVVARYAHTDFEVLLVDTSPRLAEELTAELAEKLTAAGADIMTAIAHFPADGRSPEALLAATFSRLIPDEPEARGDQERVVLDPRIKQLRTLVERVARGTLNVLLLGETGVGKEIFAEALHAASPRSSKPFLRLNCAGFTETLLESELFGHEKGAFTGANRAKPGLLETADGGTVLLDELGEIPVSLQAKLLRVIETKAVRRLGGLKERSFDVRFVAATNRDLSAEVAAGKFREDLFYRLSGISIHIPPLRERPLEIEPLARQFAAEASRQIGAPPAEITPEALELLQSHSFPGNIRELRNMLERAVLLSGGLPVRPDHLPVDNMGGSPRSAMTRAMTEAARDDIPSRLSEDERVERGRIIAVLAENSGNQTRTAEQLGISRRWLVTKMDRYNIPRPRKGRTKR